MRRLNRFAAEVSLPQGVRKAFLANSGRLREVLVAGRPALLVPRERVGRKTDLDLWAVFDGRTWILVDSRWANYLLPWAVHRGMVRALRGVKELIPEVQTMGRRLDFLASRGGKRIWVEAKSVTLVRDGVALFPDAPTPRGIGHLKALKELKARGDEALVVFMVLRGDASAFAPNWETDPRFSETLKEVHRSGVSVEAVSFTVCEGTVLDARPIPVIL